MSASDRSMASVRAFTTSMFMKRSEGNSMAVATLTFDRPKSVIQIFANQVDILKPQWRSGEWRDLAAWKPSLRSITGWGAGDRMIVNETMLDRRDDLLASDVVVLIDANNYAFAPPKMTTVTDFPGPPARRYGVRPVIHTDAESPGGGDLPACYLLSRWRGTSVRYSAYEIARNGRGTELQMGSYDLFIVPKRKMFTITDLAVGRPIRAIVNGRVGGTYGVYREERVYRHCDDIFLNLGEFTSFEVRPWNEMLIEKQVPLTDARVINLEKNLL